ncbi:FG-GAP repeat domain-containing protein [Streptomyces sp. NPDC096013]|uniref:FG-GAP repeat domain-containing protein n=1 Tax=Streptomyces sp. NPDC096013 TaxID=3366069 RepID=UPI0037F5566F
MKGRTFVRRRGLGGVALAAVLALAVGSPGVVGTASAAGAAGETVLPAGVRTVPRSAGLEGYGDTGLLSQPEGTEHQQWTDYATGQSRDLTDFSRWDGTQGQLGLAQSDTAFEALGRTPYTIRFRDIGTGADRGTVTLPSTLQPDGVAGVAVVAHEGTSRLDMRTVHVLRPTADGGTSDTVVTGIPEGAKVQSPGARDARSLLLHYRVPTDDPNVLLTQLALVDLHDGTVTPVFEPYKPNLAWIPLLTHDYVGWWQPNLGARLVRRDDPRGPAVEIPASATAGKIALTVVGDHLVAVDDSTRALLTMPLSGGEWRQLVPRAQISLTQTPDGSAVVEGGSGPRDWGVWRVTRSSEGEPTVTRIVDLPPVPAPVDGVALAGGTLTYTDQTAPSSADVMWNSRTVSTSSPPQVGPVRQGGGGKPCPTQWACTRLFALGDGSVVYDDTPGGSSGAIHRRLPSGTVDTVRVGGPFAHVVAADGRYTVVSDDTEQYVYDWTRMTVAATRTATAATVWDDQLWTTAATAGHLTLTRLGSSLPAVDVNVGSGCVPDELQVVGRWVHWACTAQGTAGVFDRSRGRSVAVPAGDALLADGFLIRHDTARGKLVRTDVRSGGAVTADVADLPATPNLDGRVASDRGIRWTLEANGDRVAYVDTAERVHILSAGTPAAPVRRDHAGRDGIADLLTLDSSGALAFQEGTGKGGFSGKVTGTGWATSIRPVAFGDLSGDGCNDVLVRFSSGALRAYKPGCGAAVRPSTPYTSLGTSGWNQYDVLTAPGDLNGDGRPDLIARSASSGTVYLYKGTSTGTLSARVKLYADWRTYKKVVGVGDLNGDGVGDLIAQDRSNTVYRYYGTGRGTFGARAKLFTAWGGSYNTVVGVGDITGDGKADLVERDSAGVLYRNSGDGRGSFGARVKIATGWQGYRGIF